VKPEVGLDWVIGNDSNNLFVFGGIEHGLKLKISTTSPEQFTVVHENKYRCSFGKTV